MLNKDSLILVFILGTNSASSEYDDNMAASKVTKDRANAAAKGSSTSQARNQSHSNLTNSTSVAGSTRIYDRRH